MKPTKCCLSFLVTVLILFSCQKNTGDGYTNMTSLEEKFFTQYSSTNPLISRIADSIHLQNINEHFVDRFSKENGLPRWNQSEIFPSAYSPDNTTVVVPLALENTKEVNGFLVCAIHKDSVAIQLIKGARYGSYGFNERQDTLNAGRVAQVLMYFDYKIFGDSLFIVNDERLLNPIPKQNTRDLALPAGNIIRLTSYTKIPDQCPSGIKIRYTDVMNSNIDPMPIDYCTVWVWTGHVPIFTAGAGLGGGSTTTTPGGSAGSGGSTQTGGWWLADPCLLWDGKKYILDAPGCTKVPPIKVIGDNPFTNTNWNYLTANERQTWDNIYKEEADANAVFNKDCQGTNRSGNIQWPGTIEHWMIMIDYISQNPVYGEVEYQIPGGSLAGNRGYADIVDRFNREMFEIKKNDLDQINNGVKELNSYLLAANANCPPKVDDGGLMAQWSAGKSYPSRIIPDPRDPLLNIRAELNQQGIIVYSSESRTTQPQPIVIPGSALDKIKNLVKKLTDNIKDFEVIIARYLDENPDLKSYLKGAAYTAAVAIIVGTIVEDFLTAGAGVADDWASFLMARRIIDFAYKL